jgi:hypothetical protein
MMWNVYTDLDPDELTEVAMETFIAWVSFALGSVSLGGRTLGKGDKSFYRSQLRGRYAASISWKKEGPNHVAIIADEDMAPEALWIEEGTKGANMKEHMLQDGKVGRNGTRYRDIPMRGEQSGPTGSLNDIVNAAANGSFSAGQKKLWAKPRPTVDSDRIVRMTDAPGSAAWIIPPMPAYSPAQILATLLRTGYGK